MVEHWNRAGGFAPFRIGTKGAGAENVISAPAVFAGGRSSAFD
jgi:hypothetical protein